MLIHFADIIIHFSLDMVFSLKHFTILMFPWKIDPGKGGKLSLFIEAQ